jgi:hypothetical protein
VANTSHVLLQLQGRCIGFVGGDRIQAYRDFGAERLKLEHLITAFGATSAEEQPAQ